MMNYETFKQRVLDTFIDYLPVSYRNKILSVQSIEKVNRVVEGLSFSSKDTNVSAVIYINDMYQEYLESGDLKKTLADAAERLVEGDCTSRRILPLVQPLNEEEIKSRIFFRLINAERNKPLLKKVPHRDYLDLSVIYQVMVSEADGSKEIGSYILTNEMYKKLSGIDLYETALANSRRAMPAIISSVKDVFMSFMDRTYPDNTAAMPELDEEFLCSNMWVITNQMGVNGAAAILYADLKELSEKQDADLCLLPSSIHEWIAVADDGDPRTLLVLENMVREINKEIVSLSDRLSDRVYRYCRKTGKIEIASKMQTL